MTCWNWIKLYIGYENFKLRGYSEYIQKEKKVYQD